MAQQRVHQDYVGVVVRRVVLKKLVVWIVCKLIECCWAKHVPRLDAAEGCSIYAALVVTDLALS